MPGKSKKAKRQVAVWKTPKRKVTKKSTTKVLNKVMDKAQALIDALDEHDESLLQCDQCKALIPNEGIHHHGDVFKGDYCATCYINTLGEAARSANYKLLIGDIVGASELLVGMYYSFIDEGQRRIPNGEALLARYGKEEWDEFNSTKDKGDLESPREAYLRMQALVAGQGLRQKIAA